MPTDHAATIDLLPSFTASQLLKAEGKCDKERGKLLDKMIDAGRGRELSSEWRKKSDPLSAKMIATSCLWIAIYDEKASRRAATGTLRKPRLT